MPKILTFTQVKKLKFEGDGKLKAYSIDSTCALYLVCFANGSKFYKLRTKQRQITLGSFDEMSLAEAREKAIYLRKNKDAIQTKVVKKTLNECFYSWLDVKQPDDDSLSAKQARRILFNRVNKHILLKIGNKSITNITKADIINATKGVNLVSAKKMIGILKNVFKHARAQNFIKDMGFIFEIIEDMASIYPDKKVEHRKAVIDKARLKEIIEMVKNSNASQSLKNLFFFNLLTAQRPHQIRELTWDRVDMDGGFVYFNEEQNKTKLNVRLPLAKKAIEILKEQNLLSGGDGVVFKSNSFSKVCGWEFSNASLMKMLKTLGINDLHAHGFRSMLATFAIRATQHIDGAERGMFEKRVIDEVLLHSVGSEVDQAYFRDYNSKEQLRLFEWWAQFLDGL